MLTPQQNQALESIQAWIRAGGSECYRLFGYAGTGKTTIAKHVMSMVDRVIFASFTGKAALVLRQKGCHAQTIHSLIYIPAEKCRLRLEQLQEDLSTLKLEDPPDLEGIAALEAEIAEEALNVNKPSWHLNMDSELSEASLLVVDEVSMVGERMGRDLLKFNTPILVLGDPAQLPPIGGGGFFTSQDPDFMLTEVHRQAADSPVLDLATKIRQGISIPIGEYGSSRVLGKGVLKIADVAAYDQVIVGTNKARRDINNQVRGFLGRRTGLPEVGDKLICLRNNADLGLLNGVQGTVTFVGGKTDDMIDLGIDIEGMPRGLTVWRHHFEEREHQLQMVRDRRAAEEFDFGYAVTCHKAQGSQWNSVLVIDESYVFRNDAKRWLYTAVTRAADSVTIVRK
jgi:exodeoxyribonuclease-5